MLSQQIEKKIENPHGQFAQLVEKYLSINDVEVLANLDEYEKKYQELFWYKENLQKTEKVMNILKTENIITPDIRQFFIKMLKNNSDSLFSIFLPIKILKDLDLLTTPDEFKKLIIHAEHLSDCLKLLQAEDESREKRHADRLFISAFRKTIIENAQDAFEIFQGLSNLRSRGLLTSENCQLILHTPKYASEMAQLIFILKEKKLLTPKIRQLLQQHAENIPSIYSILSDYECRHYYFTENINYLEFLILNSKHAKGITSVCDMLMNKGLVLKPYADFVLLKVLHQHVEDAELSALGLAVLHRYAQFRADLFNFENCKRLLQNPKTAEYTAWRLVVAKQEEFLAESRKNLTAALEKMKGGEKESKEKAVSIVSKSIFPMSAPDTLKPLSNLPKPKIP